MSKEFYKGIIDKLIERKDKITDTDFRDSLVKSYNDKNQFKDVDEGFLKRLLVDTKTQAAMRDAFGDDYLGKINAKINGTSADTGKGGQDQQNEGEEQGLAQQLISHLPGTEKEKAQIMSVLGGTATAGGGLLSGLFDFGKDGKSGWATIAGIGALLIGLLTGKGVTGGLFEGAKWFAGIMLVTSLFGHLTGGDRSQGYGNENQIASNPRDVKQEKIEDNVEITVS